MSAAGAIVALFAVGAAALLATSPPTATQLAAADPLVQLAASWIGTTGIPVVSVLPALGWWIVRRPDPAACRAAARQATVAIVAVAVALPLLRFAVGPVLPGFVPPEESARPGMALGVCAALLEEGVFRFVVLAVPYALWIRRPESRATAAVACIVGSAFVLALAHEIGPGATAFHPQYFASRVVVLGGVMGALFVGVGPAFLVAGHCAAHVALPLLFAGGAQ